MSTLNRNYYSILGVSRNASLADIKAAYRKKAKELHPDKNLSDPESAKLKFQEIVEIYEVLKDPQKRQIYDQRGEEGLKSSGFVFDRNNLDDLFAAAFGENGQDDNAQGTLANISIDTTLNDLYHGIEKSIFYEYKYNCSMCNGKGQISQEKVSDCNNCQGSGKCTKRAQIEIECKDCDGNGIRTGPISCERCDGSGECSRLWGYYGSEKCRDCNGCGYRTSFKCTDCHGTGKRKYWQRNKYVIGKCNVCKGSRQCNTISCNGCNGKGTKKESGHYEIDCKKCNGQGFKSKMKKYQCESCRGRGQFTDNNKTVVYVPAGAQHGDTLIVQHTDHERSVYGTVAVKINCNTENGTFIRNGNNLVTIKTIGLREALLGGDFVIDHIDGGKLFIKRSKNIIQFNETKKIIGKGMPVKGVKNSYGDLFIKFKIEMPNTNQLNHDQVNQLQQLCQLLPRDEQCVSGYGYNDNTINVLLSEIDGFDEMELNAIQKENVQQPQNKQEEQVDCKQM